MLYIHELDNFIAHSLHNKLVIIIFINMQTQFQVLFFFFFNTVRHSISLINLYQKIDIKITFLQIYCKKIKVNNECRIVLLQVITLTLEI